MTIFYAKIEYEYENNILFFYIDKQDISAESNISSLKGENRVIEKIDRDDLNIIIKKKKMERRNYLHILLVGNTKILYIIW